MAKRRHHQSRRARFHEHSGEERHLHGYKLTPHARHEEMMMEHGKMMRRGIKSKYDTLSHEPEMHNDEFRHDKMSERSGSYHYDRERDNMDGKYEGYRGRRHQEMLDSGMIHEDHNEIANLPQGVMIKPYGDVYGYTPEDLDDTIVGVNRQMGFDNSQKMRHFFPKKV